MRTRTREQGSEMCCSQAVDTITIGDTTLQVKGYHCAAGIEEIYIPKEKKGLWLYINITNMCNGSCKFCVNTRDRALAYDSRIDLGRLEYVLKSISDYVTGVSITGGEPMLNPDLVDKVAQLKAMYIPDVPLDLATNGTNLNRLGRLDSLSLFEGIHISRHSVNDSINMKLMGFKAPSWRDIHDFIATLNDPAQVVMNCVLQSDGVSCPEYVTSYLEAAARAGVRNVSFIGMFQVNKYCNKNYISPYPMVLQGGYRFEWNSHHDHDICSCSSWDYKCDDGEGPSIRFYYRCPGEGKANYARQLVYTADNRLLAGFGGKEIHI